MLRLHLVASGLRARLARFRLDRRGVAAVEFALLLPVLVLLYFASVEITQAFSIKYKTAIAARAVADLVAQWEAEGSRVLLSNGKSANEMPASEMQNIMNAAKAVLMPYPDSKLKVIVSSVSIDKNKVARIDWSTQLNTTARQKNQAVTLPPTLAEPETYLIWSEVKYDYTPVIGHFISGTITLSEQLYMRPRAAIDRICLTKCT